jgi:hypothetical protein
VQKALRMALGTSPSGLAAVLASGWALNSCFFSLPKRALSELHNCGNGYW